MPRLLQEIDFDGVVGKDEWEDIPMLPVMQFSPNNGLDPIEKSEIYMAYDDNYLYLAGRLYHKDMNDILAQSYKRDVFTYASDYFGIMVDQFNDNENSVGFATTSKGVRVDWTVFNDAEGEFPLNQTWNTFWDVQTSIDEKGWYVEMRVPFTSLRFNVIDGKTVMGIIYWRNIARTGESQTPPGMSNEYGGWSSFKPSQSPEFEFEGLKNKKPVYVSPYVIGGLTQSSLLNDQETEYTTENEWQRNVGLDLKFSPSSNLTMDLTFNTDFAQVEADNQQVNLTRFSLFFPEKRMFFQERSSTFSFTGSGFNTLFYSRRIGLDDGNTVPIIAGGRLVGRIGKWDLGFLNMQTAQTDNIGSLNHGVLRLRKQVINPSSYIGVMATHRTDFSTSDLSLGVDGTIKVKGMDYLLYGASSTLNDGTDNIDLAEKSKLYLQWQNRKSAGLGYNMSFARVGTDYNPVMGFELRSDITNYTPELRYGWIMGEESRLYQHQLKMESSIFTRNSDGGIRESMNSSISWRYDTKISAEGSISINNSYDEVLEPFFLSEKDSVLAGTYNFNNVELLWALPRGRNFGLEIRSTLGQFYDGNQTVVNTTIGWLPSAIFNASFTYIYNRVKVADRNLDFIANVVRLNGELSFNTKLSMAAFVQINDAAHGALVNARLRYNPREGNDLYIVFNQGMNTDRRRELPVLPELPISDSRTILVKYTHTFIW